MMSDMERAWILAPLLREIHEVGKETQRLLAKRGPGHRIELIPERAGPGIRAEWKKELRKEKRSD